MTKKLNPIKEHVQKFLENWAGPWNLATINPNSGGAPKVKPFVDAVEAAAWAVERNEAGRNVYFHINPTLKPMQKKAKKEDIKEVAWLHVDIDPVNDKSLPEERSRIEALLTTNLPAGVPKPTAVIDSGGGFWGFWRLEQPLEINGDLAKAKVAESYTKKLEELFGADNCRNIDRIARLPGTVNWPDKKKQEKGREPALSCVIEEASDWSASYSIDNFDRSTNPNAAVDEPAVEVDIADIDGPPQFLSSVDELPEKVPDWVKHVIVDGKRPDNPNRYPSRSEALYAVCCALVRAGVSDKTIYSVITDPKFKVSASVLDKKGVMKRYAISQIKSAKRTVAAGDPELQELNEKHAVILNWGGKCRIATFSFDPEDQRRKLSMQSFEDIRNAYRNKYVVVSTQDGVKHQQLGAWWLDHPGRRQYREIVFDPTNQCSEDVFNLWEGFAVEPRPGRWDRMRNHIHTVLATGDEASFNYILRWAAWTLQHPDKRAEVALVLMGGKGTGKGTFGNALCKVFGNHGLQISSSQLLIGRFNAHLRDTCFIFADEAYWPGDRSAEGALKSLITEPYIAVEAKGVDAVPTKNRLHILMASNDDWVVPASSDERRYAIFELSPNHQQDQQYFEALYRELYEEEGIEAMLHDLLDFDLGKWHPRHDIPQTVALNKQKEKGVSPVEKAWLDCLQTGELHPDFRGGDSYSPTIYTRKFAEFAKSYTHYGGVSYNEVADLFGSSTKKSKETGMWFENARTRDGRGFHIPPLHEARKRWEERRFPVAWEDDANQWMEVDNTDSDDDVPF